MLKSMREIIKDKATEDLKKRQKELYQKILYKQKLLDRYRHLIAQIAGNCSEFIIEYEMIDRTVFFREGRINIISSERKKTEKAKMTIEKNTEDLTKREASTLLEQLLAIREARQSGEERR